MLRHALRSRRMLRLVAIECTDSGKSVHGQSNEQENQRATEGTLGYVACGEL